MLRIQSAVGENGVQKLIDPSEEDVNARKSRALLSLLTDKANDERPSSPSPPPLHCNMSLSAR